ncbi:MAG: hypothetical protein R2742_03885 [Micropruina glycogenica]
MVSVWAGTNGYFDDVPVADVLRFEQELLDYMPVDRRAQDDRRNRQLGRRQRQRGRQGDRRLWAAVHHLRGQAAGPREGREAAQDKDIDVDDPDPEGLIDGSQLA